MFKFASIGRDGIGYNFDKDYHANNNGFFREPSFRLHPCANEFKTYGDGLTQHSHALAVFCNHFTDYMYSLAVYLESHPEDITEVEHYFGFRHESAISFFATIRPAIENKVKYYNATTEKVSGARSRRHDKRWERVPDWADGSLKAVFDFTVKSHYGTIERFHLMRDIMDTLDCRWLSDEDHAHILGFNKEDDNLQAGQAYDTIYNFVMGYRMTNMAKRHLECLKHNMGHGDNSSDSEGA